MPKEQNTEKPSFFIGRDRRMRKIVTSLIRDNPNMTNVEACIIVYKRIGASKKRKKRRWSRRQATTDDCRIGQGS